MGVSLTTEINLQANAFYTFALLKYKMKKMITRLYMVMSPGYISLCHCLVDLRNHGHICLTSDLKIELWWEILSPKACVTNGLWAQYTNITPLHVSFDWQIRILCIHSFVHAMTAVLSWLVQNCGSNQSLLWMLKWNLIVWDLDF